MPFVAQNNTVDTIRTAIQYAEEYKYAALLKDGSLTTTLECVLHQLKHNNVLLIFAKGSRTVQITCIS
jgi:hypothetical protein